MVLRTSAHRSGSAAMQEGDPDGDPDDDPIWDRRTGHKGMTLQQFMAYRLMVRAGHPTYFHRAGRLFQELRR